MHTVICVICGGVFTAQRSTARYCSGRCRNIAWRNRKLAPVFPDSPPRIEAAAKKNDVGAMVSEARAVSNGFAQLASTAPHQLRAGCERVGVAIHDALEVEGW